MDWTATITDVTDDLPNSDLLNIAVNFTNGTDSFDKAYNIHAADYADSDAIAEFLQGELDRFVGIKDLANSLRGVAANSSAIATKKATETPVVLDKQAEDSLTPEVG